MNTMWQKRQCVGKTWVGKRGKQLSYSTRDFICKEITRVQCKSSDGKLHRRPGGSDWELHYIPFMWMDPTRRIARSQVNCTSISSLNYGNSMVLRGEGKELKEDLKEVVLKDQEISTQQWRSLLSIYIYTYIYCETSCSFIYSWNHYNRIIDWHG